MPVICTVRYWGGGFRRKHFLSFSRLSSHLARPSAVSHGVSLYQNFAAMRSQSVVVKNSCLSLCQFLLVSESSTWRLAERLLQLPDFLLSLMPARSVMSASYFCSVQCSVQPRVCSTVSQLYSSQPGLSPLVTADRPARLAIVSN